MDDTAVLAAIRLKGYPDSPDLSNSEVSEAIAEVQRQAKFRWPLTTYGTLTLNADQDVYDIFNTVPNLSISQGVFPTGIRVVDLLWAPVDVSGSLSVFGIVPFLQGMTLFPGEIQSYSFKTPSDWTIWDTNWSQFVSRFGAQPFEHVSDTPRSPIRVFPVPASSTSAFVKYLRYRTASELNTEDESWYLELIQAQCSYTVSNKLKAVAGTKIGALAHDGKSALYWEMKGQRHEKRGWEMFEAQRYDGFAVAQRT